MKLVELEEGAESTPPQKTPAKSPGGAAPPPEIDLSEVDRILEEEARQQEQQKKRPAARPPAAAARPQGAAAPPTAEAHPAATTPAGIEEGRPFDDYYVLASVPES